MADRELRLRLVVDDSGAITKLEQLEQKIADTGSASKRTTPSLEDMQKNLKEMRGRADELGKSLTDLNEKKKATKNVTDDLIRTLGRYVSYAAVGAAIVSTIKWADSIEDLSRKTGAGTQSLQRLSNIAGLTGNSMGQITSAIEMLSDKLGSGDKAAIKQLDNLGFRLQDIKRMDPGAAFELIGRAIAQLPDYFSRSAAASDLFGRSGKDLLAVFEGLNENIGKDLPVMSDAGVRALAGLADAWEKVKTGTRAAFGDMVGYFAELARKSSTSWWGRDRAQFGQDVGAMVAGWESNPFLQPGAMVTGVNGQAWQITGTQRRGNITLPGGAPGLPTDLQDILDKYALQAVELDRKWKEQAAKQAAIDAKIPLPPWANYSSVVGGLLNPIQLPSTFTLPVAKLSDLVGKPINVGDIRAPGVSPAPFSGMGGFNWGGLAQAGGAGLLGGLLSMTTGSGARGLLSGLGSGVGSFFGPLGTAAGGFLGNLVGGLFGPSKNAQADKAASGNIDQLKAQLLETYGSLDKIRLMGDLVGVSLADAWGSKSVKGLEHFTKLMNEFETKQNQLQAALEKYGLTWEDLGEKARQAFIEMNAEALLKDFALLQQAGVDQDKLYEKMAASFSLLYDEIIRTGTTAPSALQPFFQRLVEMGLLVDSAGNKIADLAGVTFAAGIAAAGGLGAITSELGTIIDRTGQAGRAILGLPTSGLPGDEDPTTWTGPSRASGSHGRYENWGAGTLVMLHGRERVMTEREAASGIVVNVDASGAFFDTESSRAKLADRVGEVVMAKFLLSARVAGAH